MQKNFLLISLLCFLLFITMSLLVVNELTIGFDTYITTPIENTFLTSLMLTITELGSVEAILLISTILLVFLWITNQKNLFWCFAILSSGGVLLNLLLKIMFQRERPAETVMVETFGQSIGLISYSFPSGHTMRSIILFVFILYCCKYIRIRVIQSLLLIISIFFLTTIPISRVVLGAHFPTDILAAIFISLSWFYFCLYLFNSKHKLLRET
ncbi:phosphatase PAP2 family protein [Bacillus sp. FJAT-45350]|uniref:phosphatase PAP2 family protein n=1 Tax=Bacillus sp. FJAT-45350 TaxID=2011014 RepID=UPI000BB97CED|nr:phosphatase PAP2 family protein [Bacillus sp. FJAT-45350]